MALPPKRVQLIETALMLFSKYGFHGVGIDRIVREANVSKKTLYNYFGSKDELILAVLEYYDELFRHRFKTAVEQNSLSPEDKLLAIFDVAEVWFNDSHFYGCLFVGASSEFPELDTPIRDVCKRFKLLMQGHIKQLGEQAGARDADELAVQLMLLLEGATAIAQVNGNAFSAAQAKNAAAVLIKVSLN